MFNFGSNSPWQDDHPPSVLDVPRGMPDSGPSGGADAMEAGNKTDSLGGGMQVPMGSISQPSKGQILHMVLFILTNVLIFILILALFFFVPIISRLLTLTILGSLWLALLLFNVQMSSFPRHIIHTFLASKRKTRLSPSFSPGAVVIVRGPVSLLHEELLSTDFQKVPGLVLVDSSLRSFYTLGAGQSGSSMDHARQTRAVDFRITDTQSGLSAVVKASEACEIGCATTLVHVATEVPLSTAAMPSSGKSKKGADSKTDKPTSTPQFLVCKGYIRQGQVITVMGELHKDDATGELVILPLTQPYNVSKLLFYFHILPFFFPTWVSGLVISDQRSSA